METINLSGELFHRSQVRPSPLPMLIATPAPEGEANLQMRRVRHYAYRGRGQPGQAGWLRAGPLRGLSAEDPRRHHRPDPRGRDLRVGT